MRTGWRVAIAAASVFCVFSAVEALPSRESPSEQEQAQTSFKEGLRHQEAKRFQEAIDAYQASLQHDPDQAETLNNLGFCYKALKRYQKAIGYYKDAIRLQPDLAEAHEYLGEAYLEMGKPKLAMQEYETLRKLGSDEADELKEKIDAAQAAAGPQ